MRMEMAVIPDVLPIAGTIDDNPAWNRHGGSKDFRSIIQTSLGQPVVDFLS